MDIKKLSLFFTSFGAVVVHYLGGWDMLIYGLMTLMAFDYISGVLAAGRRKELSPNIAFWGITRKFMILMLVAVAVVLDIILSSQGAIRALTIIWYGSTEGLSIIENAAIIGLPVPPKLKEKLLEMRGDN